MSGGTNRHQMASKFQDIFESGDVADRLKPKYNLKIPSDGVRFKQFMYDSVERF